MDNLENMQLTEISSKELENTDGGICDESIITNGLYVTAVGVSMGNPGIAALGILAMWYGAYSC